MRRELRALARLAALIGALGACGDAPCARHSDCPTGLTCSADSVCVVAADAAAGDGEAGDVDAAADASVDVSVDASPDASIDAAADAAVDGGP